jgi:hypothetical protein
LANRARDEDEVREGGDSGEARKEDDLGEVRKGERESRREREAKCEMKMNIK